MNNKTVTPFGEYGIFIKDIRQSNVCKPDMSKLKESEYLFQRGCSFDIYKWDGEGYSQSLKFDGKDYHRPSSKNTTPFDLLVPMHIWLNDLEDLQKWLGPYYEAAIACMLAPETDDLKKSDIDDMLNELYKKTMQPDPDGWLDNQKVNPWMGNDYWTTTYNPNTTMKVK